MALVEFTPRAEKSLLEILSTKRLDETLIVVDIGEGDGEAQLSVQNADDLGRLQSDIEMVGPFRIALGSEEIALFVRELGCAASSRYELDCLSYGGTNKFQIRARETVDITD